MDGGGTQRPKEDVEGLGGIGGRNVNFEADRGEG